MAAIGGERRNVLADAGSGALREEGVRVPCGVNPRQHAGAVAPGACLGPHDPSPPCSAGARTFSTGDDAEGVAESRSAIATMQRRTRPDTPRRPRAGTRATGLVHRPAQAHTSPLRALPHVTAPAPSRNRRLRDSSCYRLREWPTSRTHSSSVTVPNGFALNLRVINLLQKQGLPFEEAGQAGQSQAGSGGAAAGGASHGSEWVPGGRQRRCALWPLRHRVPGLPGCCASAFV